MKKLFLLFLIPITVFGQLQTQNGEWYFEKVYESDLSQAEIKGKVNEWIAMTFNDANTVIKMNTAEKIIVKGRTNFDYTYNGTLIPCDLSFSLITDLKDGRYKVTMEDFSLESSMGIGKKIITPIYPNEGFTFEKFKEMYLSQIKAMPEQYQDPAMKQFNNEDQLKKLYDESLIMNSEINKNFKTKTMGMVNDLITHVDKKNEDW